MDETKKQPEEIKDVSLPASELDKVVGGAPAAATASTASQTPTESVSLNYGKVKWTSTTQ
jgi:hypothetical protein